MAKIRIAKFSTLRFFFGLVSLASTSAVSHCFSTFRPIRRRSPIVSPCSGLCVVGLALFVDYILAYTSSVSFFCLAYTSSVSFQLISLAFTPSVSHCFSMFWPIRRRSPIVSRCSGLCIVGLPLFVDESNRWNTTLCMSNDSQRPWISNTNCATSRVKQL